MQRMVMLPAGRFRHGNSARRNMQADPFEPREGWWGLEAGWEVVGYTEHPPKWDRRHEELTYAGIMLQSPRGEEMWWHWYLARGKKAFTDWRWEEWPVRRKHNDEADRSEPAKPRVNEGAK